MTQETAKLQASPYDILPPRSRRGAEKRDLECDAAIVSKQLDFDSFVYDN